MRRYILTFHVEDPGEHHAVRGLVGKFCFCFKKEEKRFNLCFMACNTVAISQYGIIKL